MKFYLVIDFDSTFVKLEGLEELAKLALKGSSQRERIIRRIKKITDLGMEGKISFNQSLKERIKIIQTNKRDIKKLVAILKKNITSSIKKNKEFFRKYGRNIYIISGGFEEWIKPLVKDYGIPLSHVLANKFCFDRKGNVTGYSSSCLLSRKKGKVKQLKKLKLKKDVYVIGDGYTDYEIKKEGLATKFFVLTENVYRSSVVNKADYILPNFDEFLYMYNLPRSVSFPKNRIKVLLLENIHRRAVEMLSKEGYGVENAPRALSEKELIDLVKRVSILGVRSKTKVNRKILGKAKRLLAVGALSVGVDNIDLKYCLKQGVVVFNAPYSSGRSVAELTVGSVIALSRKLVECSIKLHSGKWNKQSKGAHEIRGKKLGIVGYGNIGSQVSTLAESLGMIVYYYDLVERPSLGQAIKCKSLEDLLARVDIVTLHVDGRKENCNLIGEGELQMMKKGSLLINISRGFVVDEQAVVKYIQRGELAGAALDVFSREPKSSGERFRSRLRNLPNVILTPHIGGSTEEAQENIGRFVAKRIIDFINTGATDLSVNFPNVCLPEQNSFHRLIHLHRNEPGALTKINDILFENKLSIEGQYLRRDDEFSYMITDISGEYEQKMLEELEGLPETVRLRVLF